MSIATQSLDIVEELSLLEQNVNDLLVAFTLEHLDHPEFKRHRVGILKVFDQMGEIDLAGWLIEQLIEEAKQAELQTKGMQ